MSMNLTGPRVDALTGKQKAAILLIALGTETASKVTKYLTEEETELVTLEIARLGNVSTNVAQAVLDEWEQMREIHALIAEGGIDYARRVLEESLGRERADAIIKRIEAELQYSADLSNLRHADPQQLVSALRHEHPQTIALILAHVDARLTANVISMLEPDLAGDVIYRMARMGKVIPEVMRVLETSFGSDSDLKFQSDMRVAGGPKAAAEVLNLLGSSLERGLLDDIAQRDSGLADEIKDLMFVFEDIQYLDTKALQRLVRDLDSRDLALALKAASRELRDKVLSVMSQRARTATLEEMEFLGAVRLRDAEEAQAKIVAFARILEERGEIAISKGQADTMFVE